MLKKICNYLELIILTFNENIDKDQFIKIMNDLLILYTINNIELNSSKKEITLKIKDKTKKINLNVKNNKLILNEKNIPVTFEKNFNNLKSIEIESLIMEFEKLNEEQIFIGLLFGNFNYQLLLKMFKNNSQTSKTSVALLSQQPSNTSNTKQFSSQNSNNTNINSQIYLKNTLTSHMQNSNKPSTIPYSSQLPSNPASSSSIDTISNEQETSSDHTNNNNNKQNTPREENNNQQDTQNNEQEELDTTFKAINEKDNKYTIQDNGFLIEINSSLPPQIDWIYTDTDNIENNILEDSEDVNLLILKYMYLFIKQTLKNKKDSFNISDDKKTNTKTKDIFVANFSYNTTDKKFKFLVDNKNEFNNEFITEGYLKNLSLMHDLYHSLFDAREIIFQQLTTA